MDCWRRFLSAHKRCAPTSNSSLFLKNEKSCLHRALQQRRLMATSSAQKPISNSTRFLNAEFMPIYTLMGMCSIALALAGLTMVNQLKNNPNVIVSKQRRQTLAEMEDPESVLQGTENMHNTSILRKIAGNTQLHQELSSQMP